MKIKLSFDPQTNMKEDARNILRAESLFTLWKKITYTLEEHVVEITIPTEKLKEGVKKLRSFIEWGWLKGTEPPLDDIRLPYSVTPVPQQKGGLLRAALHKLGVKNIPDWIK